MAAIRVLSTASLGLAFVLSAAAQQYPADLLTGLQWRDVGPMRGGRSYAVAGNTAQPDTFYIGLGRWRRLEDRGLRPHLVSDCRRSQDWNSHRFHRRHCRRSIQPGHCLRRYRRARHSQPALVRDRRIQVDRCGKDLAIRRTCRDAADRQNCRRSRRSQSRIYCCARPRLQSQSRARRLSHHRRRSALDKDPGVRQRPGRRGRDRPGPRPPPSPDDLRISVGHAPAAVGCLRPIEHAGRRTL